MARARDNALPPLAVVNMVIPAELVIEADTLKVIDQTKIDHAGNGIRTIGGESAAGQHFNGLDQGAGDLVDIRASSALQGRARRHAAPVDQRQGVRLEPRLRKSIVEVPVAPFNWPAALPDVLLRLGAKQVFHPHRALERQFFRVHPGDRTRSDQAGFGNAGTGDGDLIQDQVGAVLLRRRADIRQNAQRDAGQYKIKLVFQWVIIQALPTLSSWKKVKEVIGRYVPDLPACVADADSRYADAVDRD